MNSQEADFILEFAKYLVKNLYRASQISILTLYTGQLLLIKNKKNSIPELRDTVISTVDNYQGEENEIILLSLVRSNKRNAIGFLKVSNRVCVALSRAKQGFYIFGNAECLKGSFYYDGQNSFSSQICQKSSLWYKVLKCFKDNKNIGKSLPLICCSHQVNFYAKNVEDIKSFLKKGCHGKCKVRKECGHSCKKMCHPFKISIDDPDGHSSILCKEK
jgi:helicase required for RNAi-mediated heterochromatin assembly 1